MTERIARSQLQVFQVAKKLTEKPSIKAREACENCKIAGPAPNRRKSLGESGGVNSEDWLENLEFSLSNKLDKKITFIRAQLQFPETEGSGPKMVYNLRVGIPPTPSKNDLEYGKPLALAPGNSLIFTLSAEELTKLKQFLAVRNFQLPDLNNLVIRIVSVVFDDGMKWEMDYYYRPNLSAPGGYERINSPPER